MKKINIKYDAISEAQFSDDLNKIISIFASDKDIHLEINIVLNALDNDEIKRILDIISKCKCFKDIHNENIYTFILTICPESDLIRSIVKIKNLLTNVDLIYSNHTIVDFLQKASKNKLPCNIIIHGNKLEEIYEEYKELSKFGYPIQVDGDICYDTVYSKLLEEWMYDRKGCRLNIFTDFVSRVLLDYWGTKCQYKSCVTKYFYVDSTQKIYACKNNQTEICNLSDVASIQDLYSKSPFIELLEQSILKREKCHNICQYYNRCQGGCPLINSKDFDDCDDKVLFEKMDEFNEQLRLLINEKDYSELNPALREIILSSLSSNKLFEKGLV